MRAVEICGNRQNPVRRNKRKIPIVTIFVQHSAHCPQRQDHFYKYCECWKHLRWRELDDKTGRSKQRTEATGERTWEGALQVRLDKQQSLRRAILGESTDGAGSLVEVSRRLEEIADKLDVIVRKMNGNAEPKKIGDRNL